MNLSKVHSKYGAPMGRREQHARFRGEITSRLRLSLVRLNNGGYDDGGAYWGWAQGLRLYRVEGEAEGHIDVGGEPIEFYLRASDREGAKAAIRALGYTSARFYR